ncbi:MAG: cupin domain-containing protein [Chloroflexi bacterium]|nr:cupin domain-containing protein [Chloroflexota bacterium]
MPGFTFAADLAAHALEIPPAGVISQTLANTDAFKATLFGFDAGQELTEHSTPQHALLQFLSGEFELTLAGEKITARTGDWLHMPPDLPHALVAKNKGKFLLVVLKN